MTKVVTMCTGTKYGGSYVNALFHQVQRHSPPGTEFICFTDNHSLVNMAEDPVLTCLIQLPNGLPLHGWWWKMWLFSPECHQCVGDHMLWLDLDTVVVGSIEKILKDFGDPKPRFLRDFTQPGIIGSGVMQIPRYWGVEIWDWFRGHAEQQMQRPGRPPDWGDQRVIMECLKRRLSPVDWTDMHLQERYPGMIVSYKFDGVREDPTQMKGASIVCFSGRPTVLDEVSRGVSWLCEAWTSGDAS